MAESLVDVVVHLVVTRVKRLVVRREMSQMHRRGEHWIGVVVGEEPAGTSEGQDVILGHGSEPGIEFSYEVVVNRNSITATSLP